MGFITHDTLISMMVPVIGALGVGLGTVIWFLFQRICKKLEYIIKRVDEVDAKNDETNHHLSVAFTNIGELKGTLKALHPKIYHD